MNLNFTYLKNNGLYQKKLNKLIHSNNIVIRQMLELYNLFHGSRTPVQYSPIFQEYLLDFYEIAPYYKGRLNAYDANEFEYLFDLVIDTEYSYRWLT